MLTLKTHSRAWLSAGSLTLALLLSSIIATPARAQSDAELRRQNQELTTQVKDLQAELDAARKQLQAAEARLAALEAQLAARAAGGGSKIIPPLEPEHVTVDESKPQASPRALFNAAVESYKQAVGSLPIGHPGDRENVAYMRAVERWAPACERSLRMPIDWHVRVLEGRRDRIAILQAVDPVTDARLGDPFQVQFPKTLATRIDDLAAGGDPGVLVLKGTSIVDITVNPDRLMPGSFDKPRFVAPYAEFEVTVDVSSIVPAKPAPSSTRPSTKPATPQPSK